MEESPINLGNSGDILFVMLSVIMMLTIQGGFAFLELGTVRKKNQVNALVKILVYFAISTIVYFLVGHSIAYGLHFHQSASSLIGNTKGYELTNFFFLLSFAAVIPAIISGGIAERAKFWTLALSAAIFVAFIYSLFEGMVWGNVSFLGQNDSWLANFSGGIPFHDYAGSVVVHSIGGWLALAGVIILGPRVGRWDSKKKSTPLPVSNIPFLALGSWMLFIGWFGFNVMSVTRISGSTGLIVVNSLFAVVGGILVSSVVSKNDPGFIHNGALAGLVAISASSDKVHPFGAFVIGAIAGFIIVKGFTWEQEKLKIDDVLGVWPLHGISGTWGGIACGIFGQEGLGGIGGVSLTAQLVGSGVAIIIAFTSGVVVFKSLDFLFGIRLSKDEEIQGSDLIIHKIDAYPENRVTKF